MIKWKWMHLSAIGVQIGVNTYVKEIFICFIFNKFAKMSKNMFSLCHYGVLCVDGRNQAVTQHNVEKSRGVDTL
jgi:hypothetical protein